METQHTLALRIPERSAASVDTFLSKPKEVEEWVKRLPMANVGETSRQVFKTLVEFNRLEISSPTRIKVAELFRQPVSYISNNLRKYYFDVSFPLSAKNRKIAVLSRELYSELAITYKIFIEHTISGKSKKFDKKLLIISIHRVIHYLSLTLFQSVIIYDPYPKQIWQRFIDSTPTQNATGFTICPSKRRVTSRAVVSVISINRYFSFPPALPTT